jgi:two-component sensor histidine kinase
MNGNPHRWRIGRRYVLISASVIIAIGGILAMTVVSLLLQRNSVLESTDNALLNDVTAAAKRLGSALTVANLSLETTKGDFLKARPVKEEHSSVSFAAFRMQDIKNVYLFDGEGRVLAAAFPRLDPSIGIGAGVLDRLRAGADASCAIMDVPAEGGRSLVLVKVLRRDYPTRYGAVIFSSSDIQERLTAILPQPGRVMGIRDASGEWLSSETEGDSFLTSRSRPMQASITLSSWLLTVSLHADRQASLRGWRSLSLMMVGIVSTFIALLIFLLVFGAKLARNADRADELAEVTEHQRADIAEARRVEQILKTSEELLQSSLEEKTTLLKEVHHRVKNNLQIVASLLNLQASRLQDGETVDAIRIVEGRILSMALLHETLYGSDSLSRIDFSAYVEKLCWQLLQSFGSSSNRVILERRVASIGLSLEQSVPCGLIINELVSNVLKHAFPGDRAGTITVEMRVDERGWCILRVHDDGVGLPAGFDAAATTSLGLRLVQKLTRQLGGRFEAGRAGNEGTSMELAFPLDTERMDGSQA